MGRQLQSQALRGDQAPETMNRIHGTQVPAGHLSTQEWASNTRLAQRGTLLWMDCKAIYSPHQWDQMDHTTQDLKGTQDLPPSRAEASVHLLPTVADTVAIKAI